MSVNVVIFSGLEWVAGYLIQGENIYKNVGMMDGNHPLMGFDDDLGYQIRKQAMAKLTYTFPVIIEKKKSPEEAIARHVEFYYLAPLLAHSIFSKTGSYLKNRQEPSLANKIINKTRQLITQNGLNSLS